MKVECGQEGIAHRRAEPIRGEYWPDRIAGRVEAMTGERAMKWRQHRNRRAHRLLLALTASADSWIVKGNSRCDPLVEDIQSSLRGIGFVVEDGNEASLA